MFISYQRKNTWFWKGRANQDSSVNQNYGIKKGLLGNRGQKSNSQKKLSMKETISKQRVYKKSNPK